MKTIVQTKAIVAWVLLIALTLTYWGFGVPHGFSGQRTGASLTILFIAAFKVRLIGIYFMELRDAPWLLRAIFESYCAILPGLLSAFYLHG